MPLPANKAYSYRIPDGLVDRIVCGSRVVVPVRTRQMVGVVTEVTREGGEDLKPVLAVPDDSPLVPAELLKLAEWMSLYYAAPLGRCLKSMLPSALWGESRLLAILVDSSAASGGASADIVKVLQRARNGEVTASSLAKRLKRPVWDALQRLSRAGAIRLETRPASTGPRPPTNKVLVLATALPSLIEREKTFGRAWKQRAAFETIDSLGGEVSASLLRETHGFSSAVLNGLVERGVATIEHRPTSRDPFTGVSDAPPESPTPEQLDAVKAIESSALGSTTTLYGVTGSGKTLVYLESMRQAVNSGGGAIILVPEISLTLQTIARVRGVFGGDVAVLHSALSDGERADAWRDLASGRKRVAVGARSAVFAPVRRLCAVVLDEEHDASYKNSESPRYHARDVAIKRTQIESCRLILSSATPSLETWSRRERTTVVCLRQRVSGQALPDVGLVDMRSEARIRESGPVPWSARMDKAVESRLRDGEQVILLLNRRGFAHYLQCTTCGEVSGCPKCSIALTLHLTPERLFCHYCGFHDPVPVGCAVCGGETQRSRGVGTQQLEHWLIERYPQARVRRMDADTTVGKWSHSKILESFGKGEVDILFGTQMIAKGLDFPRVTLVGVIDADTSLHLPDFRSAERTFQLVSQVAGRSGRSIAGGEVLIQTRHPDHFAIEFAAAHDFENFAAREIERRREPPYPPHVWLANVIVSGESEPVVANASVELGRWITELVDRTTDGGLDVVGPSPAPLARIKGRWRWHLVLRSPSRRLLGRVVRYGSRNMPRRILSGITVVYDRDPVSLF